MLIQPERATDIVLAVEKDLHAQRYLIREAVGPVEEFLGCSPIDLVDIEVEKIFPDQQARFFTEHAGFDDDSEVPEQVISHISEPLVQHKNGEPLPVELVMQLERMYRGQALYSLRVRPKAQREHRTRERVMAEAGLVKPHSAEMMDRVLQVPDVPSYMKDLRAVHEFMMSDETSCATIAVLELQHFTRIRWRHGKDYALSLLRTVAHASRNNLRREDVIARTGKAQLSYLLLDTDAAAAERVLTRLGIFLRHCRLEMADGGHVFAEIELGFQEIDRQHPLSYCENLAKTPLQRALSKKQLESIILPVR